MGRYRGIEDSKLRAKLIRKGFGQGKGSSYIPWIRVGDFPNRGESFSVWCDKTQRQHHYLSYPEYRHHLVAEYLGNVIDIQEQFPLHPIEETLCIASDYGIPHPEFGGEPCTITIDSLLTIDDGKKLFQLARSLKYSSDLVDPRIREKLALEQIICSLRNTAWEVLTEIELPRVLEKNLRWLRQWKRVERPPPDVDTCQIFVQTFCTENLSQRLGHILDRVAHKLHISRQLAIYYFQFTAWNQRLEVDLFSPLQLTKPHIALAANSRSHRSAA